MRDYDELVTTLKGFAADSKTQPLALGTALDTLDQAAYALIALILVLPFLQPVPLGPLTVLGGITFVALGWQMWCGHESPVLPQKIRNVEMSEKTWDILVRVCLKIVNFCRYFTKPRYAHLVSGRKGQKIGGAIFISAGLLMAIPFGVLPFNNMLPGFAILFFCIGELEDDGLMVIIAFGWLVLTVIYFTLFFFGLYYLGNEVFNYFKFAA